MAKILGLDALKTFKLDFGKPLSEMDPEEVLNLFLYLKAGHADETNEKGNKLGLPPELRVLQDNVEGFLVGCIKTTRGIAAKAQELLDMDRAPGIAFHAEDPIDPNLTHRDMYASSGGRCQP